MKDLYMAKLLLRTNPVFYRVISVHESKEQAKEACDKHSRTHKGAGIAYDVAPIKL